MFISRRTVIVAILLTLVAQPASALPKPQLESWLEPVGQLWQAVASIFEADAEQDAEIPSSLTEESLGWIDPSGLNGEAPSGISNEREEKGEAEFHGWIDPSGDANASK